MDTLARKIIDAIQNSLVGDLVIKLYWPVGYLWVAATEQVAYPDLSKTPMAIYFAIGVPGILLIWILGKAAKTAPRLSDEGIMLDQIARPLENGFQTWSQPPANGLRPPRAMRRIVEAIGGPKPLGDQKFGWLSGVFLIAAMLVAISLVLFPNVWSDAHPFFASEPTRLVLIQACLLILVAFQVRQWATEQKCRLASQDQPSVSTAMSPV